MDVLQEMAENKRPGQRLVAAGCLPERAGADLLRDVADLDGIIGARSWSDISRDNFRRRETAPQPFFIRPSRLFLSPRVRKK